MTDAVPASLFDALAQEPSPQPTPATAYPAADLEQTAATVHEVPCVSGAAYGAGVVVVVSALVDAG